MSKYRMKETILGNHEGKLTTIHDEEGYTTYLELSVNDNLDNFNISLDRCLDLSIRDIDHEIEKLMHIRNALVDMREDLDNDADDDMTKFFDENDIISGDEIHNDMRYFSNEGKIIKVNHEKKVNEDELFDEKEMKQICKDLDIEVADIKDIVLLGHKRIEYVEEVLAPYGFKLKMPYIPFNSEFATFENKDGDQVIIGTLKEKDKLEIWVSGLQVINLYDYDFSQLKPFYTTFRRKFMNW